MTEPHIREYLPGDLPRLGELWRDSFEDPQSLVDAIFRCLPDMGTALVATEGGRTVGMVCVLVGMELADCERKPPSCGYIWGLAVERDCRSRGLGGALARAAVAKARERGAELICTLPAEPSLYDWYRQRLGLECALYRRRYQAESAALEPVTGLSAAEYMLWRERMLAGKPHLRLSNPTLEFTRLFCESMGGGLYACGSGICAAYVEDGMTMVQELVATDPAEASAIAASVGAALGTEGAVYYLPARSGEWYIAADPGSIPPDCVWNLSFD